MRKKETTMPEVCLNSDVDGYFCHYVKVLNSIKNRGIFVRPDTLHRFLVPNWIHNFCISDDDLITRFLDEQIAVTEVGPRVYHLALRDDQDGRGWHYHVLLAGGHEASGPFGKLDQGSFDHGRIRDAVMEIGAYFGTLIPEDEISIGSDTVDTYAEWAEDCVNTGRHVIPAITRINNAEDLQLA